MKKINIDFDDLNAALKMVSVFSGNKTIKRNDLEEQLAMIKKHIPVYRKQLFGCAFRNVGVLALIGVFWYFSKMGVGEALQWVFWVNIALTLFMFFDFLRTWAALNGSLSFLVNLTNLLEADVSDLNVILAAYNQGYMANADKFQQYMAKVKG